MKAFTIFLVAVCVVGYGLIAYQRYHTETSVLLPGQTLSIENDEWIDLDIEAEYPVAITGRACGDRRTAEAHFLCGPSNVTITDLRPAMLGWSHTNRIRWRAMHHFGQ